MYNSQTASPTTYLVMFICRGFNTQYALQKAKENVERNYAVVGVLEDINTTLTVLEHYVPKFFKGAKEVYWSEYEFLLLYLLISNLFIHFFFYRSWQYISDSLDIFFFS